MDWRLAIVTVAVVAPLMVPDVAVMLALPAATPLTSPVLPMSSWMCPMMPTSLIA